MPKRFKIVLFGLDDAALDDNLVHIAKHVGMKFDARKPGAPIDTAWIEVNAGDLAFVLVTTPKMLNAKDRKEAFRDAAGVVFVADFAQTQSAANTAAVKELKALAAPLGPFEELPLVVQSTGETPKVEALKAIGVGVRKVVPAKPATGFGVVETLEEITQLIASDA